jgi:hypothetical protein
LRRWHGDLMIIIKEGKGNQDYIRSEINHDARNMSDSTFPRYN